MKLKSTTFEFGGKIPSRCAYGQYEPTVQDSVAAENRNPQLSWSEVPEGTKSFVLACLDDDVPTQFNERDQQDEIPVTQSRRRFVHWIQINVGCDVRELPEGALLDKLVPGWGRPGVNDYSRGQVVQMGEVGTGYDGPCPPVCDARWHGYRFIVIALDIPTLDVKEYFTWTDALMAMEGHILATAEWVGFYSQNPRLMA